MCTPVRAGPLAHAPRALTTRSRRGRQLAAPRVASPYPSSTPSIHTAISMSVILETASFLIRSCEERRPSNDSQNRPIPRTGSLLGDMSSGRPPIHVSKDDVDRFRRLGTKWVEIARIVGVSVSKLEAWRRETGYEDPLDHGQTPSEKSLCPEAMSSV